MINFDITSKNNAYDFLLNNYFTTKKEINDYKEDFFTNYINLYKKFENKKYQKEDIKIFSLHLTASIDECKSIKKFGIIDLKLALSQSTPLSNYFQECNIYFHIKNEFFYMNGEKFDINYQTLQKQKRENKYLLKISRKIYDDYQVNSFLFLNHISEYLTRIDEVPEFLNDIYNFNHDFSLLDKWRKNSKPFLIKFFSDINNFNIHSFEKYDEYEYSSLDDLFNEWMFRVSLGRVFDLEINQYLYMKKNIQVHPAQIFDMNYQLI